MSFVKTADDTFYSEATLAGMRADFYVRIAALWVKLNEAWTLDRKRALAAEIEAVEAALAAFEADPSA